MPYQLSTIKYTRSRSGASGQELCECSRDENTLSDIPLITVNRHDTVRDTDTDWRKAIATTANPLNEVNP